MTRRRPNADRDQLFASIHAAQPRWREAIVQDAVVTLRYRGKLHHIGIGAAYRGWRIVMLVEGPNIEILGLDGSLLRRLELDPTKDYHAQP